MGIWQKAQSSSKNNNQLDEPFQHYNLPTQKNRYLTSEINGTWNFQDGKIYQNEVWIRLLPENRLKRMYHPMWLPEIRAASQRCRC